MTTTIKKNDGGTLILEVTIPLGATMLGGEQDIEQALNEAGALASGELLKRFDTDGSSIQIGAQTYTSKSMVYPMRINVP